MKHFVTTTAALLLLSLSSWAGYEDGAVAFEKGDFEAALAEWRPLADQGHAQAQHNVGVMYATGQGVSQSFDEARKWFLRAAEQGLGQAAKSLGTTYSKGHGVEKDLVQAYTWFEIAETLGDKGAIEAQRNASIRMTTAQLDQAERAAQEWLQTHHAEFETAAGPLASSGPLEALRLTGACSGCNLREADLRGVDLRDADLSGADLRGAFLFLSDLTGTNLNGADLDGANLYGAKLCRTVMPSGSVDDTGC